jgi:hypothetical protein
MGAQSSTPAILDFGAFPGATDCSLAITGQASILSGSDVEAWLVPVATADHSADEHLVEHLRILAGNIVAGTGFTIYALDDNQIVEPTTAQGRGAVPVASSPKVYGKWSVNWVWN